MPSSTSAEASSSSAGSSAAVRKRPSSSLRTTDAALARLSPSALPLERLVEYLMEAKRSLASMHQLMRAGEMVAKATQYHEHSVKMSADGCFLYWGLTSLMAELDGMKRGFIRTYEKQKRNFDANIHLLDVSVGRLTGILERLENIPVDPAFRPEGESAKNLKDFVDEANVHNLIDALKGCINELKAAETSFAGDIFRLETDIGVVKSRMNGIPLPELPPSPGYLMELSDQSYHMGLTLMSLTKHFDMCVRAVRASEGGIELALQRDAEASERASFNGGVELPDLTHRLQPDDGAPVKDLVLPAAELEDLVQIVVQDAVLVQPTVREMSTTLEGMAPILAAAKAQSDSCEAVCMALVQAFYHAESVRRKVASYQAAEREFKERIAAEQDTIDSCEAQVTELTRFYEGYMAAYAQLKVEYKRRRAVDDKIQAVLQKAAEAIERYREQDRVARQQVESSYGAFLPKDLWVTMDEPIREYKFVVVDDRGSNSATADGPGAAGITAKTPANGEFAEPQSN